MNKSLEQVKQFHETFNHPVGEIGKEPLAVRQLRIKLLFEELQELAEASDCMGTFRDLCIPVEKHYTDVIGEPIPDGDDVNIVEELDALADIQYVLNGKILTAGLHNCFDENFDLVHANNMNKLHRDWEHAEETVDKGRLNNIELFKLQVEVDGYLLVKVFNNAGKIIKPHDFEKVQLKVY